MKIKLDVKNCSIFFISILYRFPLEWVYKNYLLRGWQYYGFTYSEDLSRYIVSWIIYSIILLVMLISKPFTGISFSNTVPILIFYMHVAPCYVMAGYKDTPFLPLLTIYFLLLYLGKFMMPNFNVGMANKLSRRNRRFLFASIILVILGNTIFVWAVYARFHIQLSLTEVYEQRAVAAGLSMPLPMRYILGMGMTCFPVLTAWGLYKKNTKFVVWSIIGQTIYFFIVGSKAAYYQLILAIILYFVFRYHKERVRLLPLAFFSLCIFGIIALVLFDEQFICNFLIRRSLFVPATLNYGYYEIISQGGPDFFRQSFLRLLGFESQYSAEIPYLVGNLYTTSGMYANNGCFSDAYKMFGAAGVFIMPLVIRILLRLSDRCSRNIDGSVLFSAFLMVTAYITGTSLLTALFSHGLVLLIILLRLISDYELDHPLEKYVINCKLD